LEKVPRVAKRNVCCAVAGWNILYTGRSIRSMVSFSSWISLLLFCLTYLSVGDRGVLTSPTTTVLESICVFKSFSVYLMKLGALTLDAYSLIIVISSWCIAPFFGMKCPSLSHFTNIHLNSTLSDIRIASPVCFQGPLA
jgi:hypothetical protein